MTDPTPTERRQRAPAARRRPGHASSAPRVCGPGSRSTVRDARDPADRLDDQQQRMDRQDQRLKALEARVKDLERATPSTCASGERRDAQFGALEVRLGGPRAEPRRRPRRASRRPRSTTRALPRGAGCSTRCAPSTRGSGPGCRSSAPTRSGCGGSRSRWPSCTRGTAGTSSEPPRRRSGRRRSAQAEVGAQISPARSAAAPRARPARGRRAPGRTRRRPAARDRAAVGLHSEVAVGQHPHVERAPHELLAAPGVGPPARLRHRHVDRQRADLDPASARHATPRRRSSPILPRGGGAALVDRAIPE